MGHAATQRRKKTTLRPISQLYFKNSRGTKAWQMKKILFDTIYDRKTQKVPPLIFIRNIGNSMLEILVAKGLEDKVKSILYQWGFNPIDDDIDPIAGLLKKSKEANAVQNAQKCREKALHIVKTFSGPEVVNYYKGLIARADAVIASSSANDIRTPEPTETAATAKTTTTDSNANTPAAETPVDATSTDPENTLKNNSENAAADGPPTNVEIIIPETPPPDGSKRTDDMDLTLANPESPHQEESDK